MSNPTPREEPTRPETEMSSAAGEAATHLEGADNQEIVASNSPAGVVEERASEAKAGPENGNASDGGSAGQGVTANLPADVLEAVGSDNSFVPPREPLGARLAGYFGRHQLLLFGLILICLWAIIATPPLSRETVTPGQPADRDYLATHSAFVQDKLETERRRESAAALVPPAYSLNTNASELALVSLREHLKSLRLAAQRTSANANGPAEGLFAGSAGSSSQEGRFQEGRTQDGRSLDGATPAAQAGGTQAGPEGAVASASARRLGQYGLRPGSVTPADVDKIGRAAGSAVRAVYLKGRIRSDVADDWKSVRPLAARRIDEIVKAGQLPQAYAAAARQLAWDVVRFPNVVVNERATEDARQDVRRSVLPVYLRVEANSVLVRKDQVVTEELYAQLRDMGLVNRAFSPTTALAQLVLCAMMVGAAAAYLARSRRDLLNRPAALWLVAVVPTTYLFAFRLALAVPHSDYVMAPLAASAAMLITVLVDARMGLAVGLTVASLSAMLVGADAGLFFSATLLTWISTLAVGRISSRYQLSWATFLVAVSNAALSLANGVLRGAPVEELYSSALWSGGAGIGAIFLMYAGVTSLERPFGITSHLRLLELLSPDEAIMRRMQTEAPGTYTHSLMVATLSESAAKKVGADPLLCRVAGLYHDIGKLRRPHCFIENQSGDNIHDRLTPGLSALLIRAHVKDGWELGRALRLPEPVLDIIQEHHGTSLISYFYHRAREQAAASGGSVDEKTFRYPGPKAQSKESAIVMLADSVEASARALPQITPESLAAHIKGIIDSKLRDGELDQASLTLRELDVVQEAFTTALKGAMHHRIEYPDPAALSGELNAPADGWVRETLGEKPENTEKSVRKPVQVATSDEKRQNKVHTRDGSGKNGKTVGRDEAARQGASGATAAVPENQRKENLNHEGETARPGRRRRRRFKAPFYPSSENTLHVERPAGPAPKSAAGHKKSDQDESFVQLEPGRAPRAQDTEPGAKNSSANGSSSAGPRTPQPNSAPGSAPHNPDGAAALPRAVRSAQAPGNS